MAEESKFSEGRFLARVHEFNGHASVSVSFSPLPDKSFIWHMGYRDACALRRLLARMGPSLEQMHLEVEARKRKAAHMRRSEG